ncbi:MAG: hypothetical protein LH481_07070 [Burkholderiales bacterium]|nr:hypothetical protein [Burkholderiales bacterium]
MTDPIIPSTVGASLASTAQVEKVAMSDWAIAVLLTLLVGLSGAALLGATFMELLFDKMSAVMRIVVLLPVLVISAYLLVQKWRMLIHRHDATKK